MQDGYRVALPEYLVDAPPADPAEAAALAEAAAEVSSLADGWVSRLRGLAEVSGGTCFSGEGPGC